MPSNFPAPSQTHVLTLSSPNLDTRLLAIQHLARQVFEPDVHEPEHESRPKTAWQLQISTWRERLNINPSSAVIYITSEAAPHATSSTTLSSTDNRPGIAHTTNAEQGSPKVTGFFLVHPRPLPQPQLAALRTNNIDTAGPILANSDMQNAQERTHDHGFEFGSTGTLSYHIFLAAVHPSMRGRGLFSVLLDAAKARARGFGFEVLTVATIPARFQGMYGILGRPGNGWVVLEWKEVGGEAEAGGDGDGQRKVVMGMDLRDAS